MGEELLKAEDLQISFKTFQGEAKVVERINVEISKGDVVGLVGETGCGKSIVMKSILRLLPSPPAEVNGKIIFEGEELMTMPESKIIKYRGTKMSYIPQHPQESLAPVFTIKEQFLDMLLFRGMPKVSRLTYYSKRSDKNETKKALDRILELLRDVRIPDPEIILDYYPYQLSGGMAQRILIAMALSGSPDLLLADEPTTALDVTIQKQILDLLKDLIKKYHLSILFVTHNLGIAREITNKIYIMYAGKIVEYGETSEVFANPKHPYTAGLLTSVPKLSGERFQGISGTIPNYVEPPNGCRFNPRCEHVMDICKIKEPKLIDVENGHLVACFLMGGNDE